MHMVLDCNQARQRNKRHPKWKKYIKMLLVGDDLILCLENPEDSTKNTVGMNQQFQ